jgi:hypothetical protein
MVLADLDQFSFERAALNEPTFDMFQLEELCRLKASPSGDQV